MCNVAREGLGEKSMRSFLVSRLTVITLGSIYCSTRGLSQYLIGESGLRKKKKKRDKPLVIANSTNSY